MFRRSRMGVIFAIVLGLVAALLVWNYTHQLQAQVQKDQAAATAKAAAAVTNVLVAAHDIPARTDLGAADVKVIQIPVEAKLPDALTSPDDAIGKTVAYPLASGEQILPMKFAAPRTDTGFADTIPPGKIAMAVTVDEVTNAGGLVTPGDRVDVLASFTKEQMGKDMATIVLQNVEVLAVAQAYAGEIDNAPSPSNLTSKVAGAVPNAAATPDAKLGPLPTATPAVPLHNPKAQTVTLAVTPEESERLLLAEADGKLRLALRSPSDSSVVTIPEATLSNIRTTIDVPTAQITGVSFSPTNMRAGDTLKVQITVKNTSNKVIPTQKPDPGFTYVEGQTYNTQNFPSETGKFRVGINFDGHPAVPFPYRWGLGGDLPPGATTTVVGYIKLTYDIQPTNFWAGLIQEPATVIQDNEGTTLISVLPVNVAVVSVDAANVRSGPDISSSVIDQLKYGTQVPIVGQQQDWFKVKLPDGREGFVAAGWIIAPTGASAGPPPPTNPVPASKTAGR
jgi:pilus assembly protein CpaB